jgi:hypothetical protein
LIYKSVLIHKYRIGKHLVLIAFFACAFAFDALAQYKKESDASIPLEHFYIERQKGNALRYMLSKLNFSFSTGYGGTAFKHKLDGFGIKQRTGRAPEIFTGNNLTQSYSNWVNDVGIDSTVAIPAFAVSSDTAALGFKSSTFSIPLKATVHLEFDRFRVGGGYSFDYTRIGKFKPLNYADDIDAFKLDKQGFFMKHYFVMAGASVYRYYEYLLVVDLNIGGYKLGRQFNMGVIQKGVYVNIGVTAERQMSEYFKLFVRPSYEIKGYKLLLPESGGAIQHRMNTVFVNVGFTYRIPETPRCFIKGCHAQINHAHGNKEYRSRRHPFYKKQNPHYGENYPSLIKYKGKNKRKLNPY